MNPYWTLLARRNWQVLLAVGVFAGFTIAHTAVFQPALARYRSAASQAARLGSPLGAADVAPAPTARVAALLAAGSLPAAAAEEQGASGALTAGLLDEVTRLAAARGLEVLATEQGLVTQLPGSVLVRAHFRMAGGYSRFAGLLDDFARSGTLITVERFTLEDTGSEGGNIEVWLCRLVLKRTRSQR